MKLIKFADGVIAAAALLIFAVFFILSMQTSTGKAEVFISGADGDFLYSLDDNEVIEVHGPIGVTIVEIHNREVRVLDSPCPDKLCVYSGVLTKLRRWTACAPNGVTVVLRGSFTNDNKETGNEVDAVAF